MIVTFLRIVSGLFFLPAIWLASMTFMAQPKSVVDYLGLYPFWMVPALLLATACGLWWTMPMQRLLPLVMVLPIILWLAVVGIVFAIAGLST